MHNENSRQLNTTADVRDFLLGGHAIFTVVSKKSGTRFTFKVERAEARGDDRDPPWFVAVLTGSNNTEDYSYLGTIFSGGNFVHGRKSRLSPQAPSAVAFKWLHTEIMNGSDFSRVMEFWHEGSCCRCGRPLTDPESIERGIGPVCLEKAA